jgi:predicted transcriptional regulator of viral defense system
MTASDFVLQYARNCGTSTFAKTELSISNPNRNGETQLTEILTRLVKKGYLVRVKNGLYAINTSRYSF